MCGNQFSSCLRTPIIFIVGFILASCTSTSNADLLLLTEDEVRLETDNSSRQYHSLVANTYSTVLNFPGYIIGVEKSPKAIIGYPRTDSTLSSPFKAFDDRHLRTWRLNDAIGGPTQLSARNYHMERVFDDPKSMFVSQVLKYSGAKSSVGTAVSPFYLSYRESGFQGRQDGVSCFSRAGGRVHEYDDSWKVLRCLSENVDRTFGEAGGAFTHLVIISMGWNNNQVESVKRFNGVLGRIRAEAAHANEPGHEFHPLVIGLTWPSVWGGDAFSNAVNKITHIASYVNKADDADEIGYTYANHLLNRVAPYLSAKHNLQTVVIGHSFGARILSRAHYSGHLLKSAPPAGPVESHPPILINLLGAYSARRFDENTTQPAHKRLFHQGEGAPYAIHPKVAGKVVLVWSARDSANPMARYLSGTTHVGGRLGYEEIVEQIPQRFIDVSLSPKESVGKDFQRKIDCDRDEEKHQNRIALVNGTSFIANHNDIRSRAMGSLLWGIIRCFAR
jgi:hypothetical protein